MASYTIGSDGDKVFVVQASKIGVQLEDGTYREVVGPKDFKNPQWDEVEGKPKLLQVGAKAGDAKPGNWKPSFSDVKDAEDGVKKILVEKLATLPVITYGATTDEIVDQINTILNLLRK